MIKNIKLSELEVNKGQINYKQLDKYPHYVFYSNGDVYSLYSNKKLKPCITKAGYYTITFCENKKRISKNIHRLIAESFLGISELDINHKDGNKLNNDINNLEYCTKKYNSQHAIKNKLWIPNTKKIAEEKRKSVYQINIKDNFIIKRYSSAHEAARKTGANRGNISSCCRGEKLFANGYRWIYAN